MVTEINHSRAITQRSIRPMLAICTICDCVMPSGSKDPCFFLPRIRHNDHAYKLILPASQFSECSYSFVILRIKSVFCSYFAEVCVKYYETVCKYEHISACS